MKFREAVKRITRRIGIYKQAAGLFRWILFWSVLFRQVPRNFNLYLYNHWVTGIPIYLLRLLWARHILGVTVGKGSFLHMHVRFYGNVVIGEDTVIGRNVVFSGETTIGNHCSITADTCFVAASHDKDSEDFRGTYAPIHIDDYAWIGMRAMLLPGVHVYTGGVLGAQSVAVKDVPAYTVYAGNPARQVGIRRTGMNYELRYFPFFC